MLVLLVAKYMFIVFQRAKWCVDWSEVAYFYALLYSALARPIWLADVKLAVKLLRIFRRQVVWCWCLTLN